MSKYFNIPFADIGDKTVIPDASQPDGSVNFTDGWTPDYSKNQGDTGAKEITRQSENYFKFIVTEAIKEIQERGFKVYDPLVNYPVGAITPGSDNILYECLIANGPDPTFLPVVDPVGDVTGTWVKPDESTWSIIDIIDFDGLVTTFDYTGLGKYSEVRMIFSPAMPTTSIIGPCVHTINGLVDGVVAGSMHYYTSHQTFNQSGFSGGTVPSAATSIGTTGDPRTGEIRLTGFSDADEEKDLIYTFQGNQIAGVTTAFSSYNFMGRYDIISSPYDYVNGVRLSCGGLWRGTITVIGALK